MHPIKRFFLIGLFSLGTIGGFTHGFDHLGSCASSCHANRRAAFEERVADVCTRSAERVWQERGAMNGASGSVAAPPAVPSTTFTITGPGTLTLGAPVAPAALAPATLAPATVVPTPAAAAPAAEAPVDAPPTP